MKRRIPHAAQALKQRRASREALNRQGNTGKAAMSWRRFLRQCLAQPHQAMPPARRGPVSASQADPARRARLAALFEEGNRSVQAAIEQLALYAAEETQECPRDSDPAPGQLSPEALMAWLYSDDGAE